MTFDVSRVRAAYPALSDGYAYLDGAAGTQVPSAVIEAIADAYRAGIGNAGGAFPASRRSDVILAECRRAVADLTGAVPEGVILGPNMTTLGQKTHLSVGDLFGYITTNMPMNDPASLSHAQYVVVLAYILKQNGYPAGPRPLTYAGASSSGVRIASYR